MIDTYVHYWFSLSLRYCLLCELYAISFIILHAIMQSHFYCVWTLRNFTDPTARIASSAAFLHYHSCALFDSLDFIILSALILSRWMAKISCNAKGFCLFLSHNVNFEIILLNPLLIGIFLSLFWYTIIVSQYAWDLSWYPWLFLW